MYRVTIAIRTLPKANWKCIKQDCSQSIGSLIELLQGRFDESVMRRLTRQQDGLFPQPREIKMQCSCPDGASMCKHVAAVLYGVGARLDVSPELLFTLRDVDHLELISQAVAAENLDQTLGGKTDAALAGSDLGELFGIELAGEEAPPLARNKRPNAKKPTPARRRKLASPPPPKTAEPQARTKKRPAKKTADQQIDETGEATRPTARRKRATKPRQAVTR